MDTSKILDLKSEMQSRCERFGLVKKVVVYDVSFYCETGMYHK